MTNWSDVGLWFGEWRMIPDGDNTAFVYWKNNMQPDDVKQIVREAYESGYERGGKETVIEGDRKEILIDSLCDEFGITEGKMRRAIDSANKKIKRKRVKMSKIDITTNHLSKYDYLNSLISAETISIKDPYCVAPPSVEKITEALRKNIEESLKLVKLLQELGLGGHHTENSLHEVLDDVENLEIHGRILKPGE